MKKLVAIVFLTAVAAFPQRMRIKPIAAPAPTVSYEQIAPDCSGLAFPDELSSGCMGPRIKVTAHPSNPDAVGFFVLVVYTSKTFNLPVAQPHYTMERDANGDFICVFPSGDMSQITISAAEVHPGELIVAPAPAN